MEGVNDPLRPWRVIAGVPVLVRSPVIRLPEGMRKRDFLETYKCFVGNSATWKSRAASIRAPDPPPELEAPPWKFIVSVVMGRAPTVSAAEEARKRLAGAGLRLNPYSVNRCFGFYVRGATDLAEAAGLVSGIAEALAIVNSVVIARLPYLINLRELARRGFIVSTYSGFKAVRGRVDGHTVRVLYRGLIVVTSPLPPDPAWVEPVLRRIRAVVEPAGIRRAARHSH